MTKKNLHFPTFSHPQSDSVSTSIPPILEGPPLKVQWTVPRVDRLPGDINLK